MNYQDSKRLIKHYEKALERKNEWTLFKACAGNRESLLSVNGSEFQLTTEEYKMICNILDNTINTRYNNLKERLEKELNITVEV